MLRFKTKFIVTLFLSHFLIRSCPLECLLRFPTKFLVKMRFRDFRIFPRFYLIFCDFCTPKTTKKLLLQVSERCVAAAKLTFASSNTY